MKDFLKKSALIVCASLLLFACKNEGGGTSVAFDQGNIILEVGETATLKVTVSPEAEAANLVWSSDDTSVATVDKKGEVTAVELGVATITARAGEAYAECIVIVSSKPATSITLDIDSTTLPIGGIVELTATVEPRDATDEIDWVSSDPSIATVEEGVVTAIAEGDVIITASVGELFATCEISVYGAPKVGDYFYSDGTWSDGGLISIEAHGLNPVWKEEKPAPKAGKTVIGIVFQTDQSRMNENDKAAGYTHGYVMALKNICEADEPTKTTAWSNDWDFSSLTAKKLAKSWYENVAGYQETMKVRDDYGPNLAQWMPAFDLTLNHYPVEAPESTSGWFLPSTGQMWDLMANLCGGGAATIMKGWETYSRDATWYCSEKVDYDALAYLNSMMSKIPDEDKELFAPIDRFHTYTSIWTSTPYDSEAACQVNIGPDGLVELMCDYYDGGCYCRPILAF